MINKLDSKIISKLIFVNEYKNIVVIIRKIIENSCDAGSSMIGINIKNFDTFTIQIVDNGIGISELDMKNLGKRYYTSKISSVEDLYNLKTYGFKGETLFFAKSIFDIKVISKTRNQKFGKKINLNNNILEINNFICENGTTIELICRKNTKIKINRIIREIRYLALVNPNIKIKITTGNKNIIRLNHTKNINLEYLTKHSSSDAKMYKLQGNDFRSTIIYNIDNITKKIILLFINKIFISNLLIKQILIEKLESKFKKHKGFLIIISLDLHNLSYISSTLIESNNLNRSMLSSIISVINNFFDYIKIDKMKDRYDSKNKNKTNTKCNKCFYLYNTKNENKNGIKLIEYNIRYSIIVKINKHVYYTKNYLILKKIVYNNLIYQFLENGKIESSNLDQYLLYRTKNIHHFNEMKIIFKLYGFILVTVDNNYIKLITAPKILHNLKLNWLILLEKIKSLVKLSRMYYNSPNRIEVRIIKLISESICKNIEIENSQITFLENEILNIMENDIDWFNSNFKNLRI